MNIIGTTYKNIGPYENTLITISFKDGKYLINAPIGKGKSFLFFDGPLFGLYKYSQRTILNRKSKEGFVKILFNEGDDYFLVTRQIKPTKSGGDSISSFLYKIDAGNIDLGLDNIINYDLDIENILKKKYTQEEIKFKNNNELQNVLEDILPKKEVFLSTYFLMQDSDNIFEIAPSDRINIFKNLFGLIGIDEAKDIISENKKEVQYTIKVKKDKSNYNKKLKDNLEILLNEKNILFSYTNSTIDNSINELISEFLNTYIIKDLDIILDNANIEGLVIDDELFGIIKSLKNDIEIKKKKINDLNSILNNEKNNISNYNSDNKRLTLNIKELEKLNIELDKTISSFDEKRLNDYKNKKEEISIKLKNTNSKVNYEIFSSNGYDIKDLAEANDVIDKIISHGKELKLEKENYQLKLKNLESDYNEKLNKIEQLKITDGTDSFNELKKEKDNRIDSILGKIEIEKNKISSNVDRIEFIKKQILDIDTKVNSLSEDKKFELDYYCQKIGSNCPYTYEIKKESLQLIQKEINDYSKKKNELLNSIDENGYNIKIEESKSYIKILEKEIDDISNNPNNYFKEFVGQIEEKRNILQRELNEINYISELEKLKKEIKHIDEYSFKYKEFLSLCERKNIKILFENYKKLFYEYQDIDEIISQLEKTGKDIENVKNKKKENIIKINELSNQINYNKKKIAEIEIKIEAINHDIKSISIDNILNLENSVDKIVNSLNIINGILSDYNESKLKIIELENKEKKLSDLYNIFSKDLMLIVLQEFLPILLDYINILLSAVVDYEVKFDIIKKTSEKLELEILVYDEKGERNVKSLSGGQKTILKLVWILAIASLMKTKFLFLDETINNLDESSVGRVSNMIEDFVHKNDVKFYVVTHSQQIKDMNIWNDKINL